MKCYFAFDEQTNQKVLIPGCMSVVHSNDIEDCTCQELTYSKKAVKLSSENILQKKLL